MAKSISTNKQTYLSKQCQDKEILSRTWRYYNEAVQRAVIKNKCIFLVSCFTFLQQCDFPDDSQVTCYSATKLQV